MGFAPYQPDLFAEPCQKAEWSRPLKRPRCIEYWSPAAPGKVRREMAQKSPEQQPVIEWRKV